MRPFRKSLFIAAIVTIAFNMPLSAIASANDYLVTNVRILDATQEGADVLSEPTNILISNGKISQIGTNLTAPDNAQTIDGSGKQISSGLFNGDTELGIVEIGAVATTVDSSSLNPRITASLRAADAINPSSVLLPHNRMLGLTHALVMPSAEAGLFAGTAAIIRLSETDTLLKSAAGLVVNFGEYGHEIAGGSRAAALAQLREAFEDARDYRANKASYNAGNRRDYPMSRHDLEALIPVIERTIPLIVLVDRAADIERVIEFANQHRLRLILAGAEEGWRVADSIAKNKVPVIIDPIQNLPSSYDTLGARLDNAKLLNEAGVELIFTGMSWHNTHNAYLVRQSAGNAVANGLPYKVALAAVTSTPAKVFGISEMGKVRAGAAANLVLWSGDPFEPATVVEQVWMNGVTKPLISRMTRLRDRYFERLSEATD